MNDIQFGDRVITGEESQKENWSDLARAPTNTFFLSVLDAQTAEVFTGLRKAIEEGNLAQAAEANGYMKCLEDIGELLGKNIAESLQGKSV